MCTLLNIPKAGNYFRQHLTQSEISFCKIGQIAKEFPAPLFLFPIVVALVPSALLKRGKFFQSATLLLFLCGPSNHTQNGVKSTKLTDR